MGFMEFIFGNKSKVQASNDLTYEYDGVNVNHEKATEALSFLLAVELLEEKYLEKDFNQPRGILLDHYQEEMEMAIATLRDYGEQLQPATLDKMRAEYYSWVNDRDKFTTGLEVSIVSSYLQKAWDGINGWQS